MAGVLFPAAAVISAGAELNANLECQRRFQLFFSLDFLMRMRPVQDDTLLQDFDLFLAWVTLGENEIF